LLQIVFVDTMTWWSQARVVVDRKRFHQLILIFRQFKL